MPVCLHIFVIIMAQHCNAGFTSRTKEIISRGKNIADGYLMAKYAT